MAPYLDQALLDKGVRAYMASIADQKCLRFDKKIVGSEEFKDFLFYLSERSPFALDKLLKKVSRNCADALRKERDARKNKKRAASPNCDARNIKRHKTSYTVHEETFQPVGTNGDKEAPTKVENPSPQSNPQFTKTALPNTLVLDIGTESESGRLRFVVSTKHEIESGLMMGSPIVEAYVRASLVALKPSTERPSFNIDNEIAKVWKIIPFLEFYKTRRELEQHLENREKTPDEKLQSRTIWGSSDPGEILDTLENVRMSSLDNKIHRAYGQTILVWSVDAQVARGCKTVTGHRSNQMTIFEELARKKAGSVSKAELAQIASSYFYEYQSGQKWSAIIDWFGGRGIVLIFIIAGNSYTLSTRQVAPLLTFCRHRNLVHEAVDGIFTKLRKAHRRTPLQHQRIGRDSWF